MKKLTPLFILMILVFSGCSTESLEDQGQISNFDLKGGKAAEKVTTQEAINPMGFYAGESGNLLGTYAISNDCTNMYIEITPSGEEPDGVSIWLSEGIPSINNGGNITDDPSYILSDAVNLIWTIPLSEFNTENDINVFVKAYGHFAGPLSYSPEGSNKSVAYSSYAFDLSGCNCEETFSYDEAGDDDPTTYTFYYTPAENIDNAEVIFTFAQATVRELIDSNVAVEWQAAGQTEHIFADLSACEEYWWTISLTKDCNGSTPNNNVWTDFKIKIGEDDAVSKKNISEPTPNITQSCD